MAVPPSSLMIAAVLSIVSGRPYGERLPGTLRPVQYTSAPASPSARAIPRPAPRVAPATTAILSSIALEPPEKPFEIPVIVSFDVQDLQRIGCQWAIRAKGTWLGGQGLRASL